MSKNRTPDSSAEQHDRAKSEAAAALEALQASEIRYRRLFESAKDGILILDAKTGMVADVNPYLLDLLGYSRTEVIGKKVWELGFLVDVVANADRFLELKQEEYVRYDNLALEGCDGRRHEVEFISNVYPEGSHEVIQCNIRDISVRKRNEARIHHLAQMLRALRNVNHLIIHEKDRDALLRQTCHVLTETRGYPFAWIALLDGADNLRVVGDSGLGETLEEFRSFLKTAPWPECCRRALGSSDILIMHGTQENCSTCPLQYKYRDNAAFAVGLRHGGRNYGVLVVALPQKVANDPQEQSLFKELAGDIGYALHSLQTEAEQHKSEETVRAMFDGILDGILLADAETQRFLNANNAMCRLLGYTLEEIRGLSLSDIHPPESLEHVSTKYARQARGKVALATNIPVLRKDGSIFSADVNTTALEIDGRRCMLAVFRDITARLVLESQLQQTQKMESIGRLAGGVAHDFNNMLTIILGHTDMILEQIDPDQPFRAKLTEIRKAGQRSANLTRQLLAFARKQTVTPKVIDLNNTVAGMTSMLHRLIGEDIDMSWIPGEKVWPVKIDPGQIDQILANLCVNARDAIADVGKVTIETDNSVFDEDYCLDHAGFVPGQYALLAVSDNGCGMDSETLSHLFEPFFTTKELGKGTGLGLATVYGVVKQNKGFINVYSEPGQGTTFKIYLPRHLAKAGPVPEKGPDKPSERGHETVLLVEDESAILRLASMMLEQEGYTVVAAGTPGEAIRLANEHAGDIHLLMSDVVMPEMNCRDLAKNILALYPHLKCLFMSGYTADVIAHHGVLDKGVNFIQKPFSKGDLTAKVREVLDRD